MKKSKLDWQWLTGFWEADGSIFVTSQKHYAPYLRIDISQKDKNILVHIRNFLLKHKINCFFEAYRKRAGCWHLRLSTRYAEKFVKHIYPFVQSCLKRQRIRRCIGLVNLAPNLKTKYTWLEGKPDGKKT